MGRNARLLLQTCNRSQTVRHQRIDATCQRHFIQVISTFGKDAIVDHVGEMVIKCIHQTTVLDEQIICLDRERPGNNDFEKATRLLLAHMFDTITALLEDTKDALDCSESPLFLVLVCDSGMAHECG